MQAEKTTTRVFRFGAFEVNESAEELRKHGIRLKLHSQPFQILLMLVEAPSQLITREQLRLRLWPENTFVDFDHGLNTAVNKLRQALSDSAMEPRYIETVPGKGYRFIAPVTVVEPSQESTKMMSPPVTPATVALLTTPSELPKAPRKLAIGLLLAAQLMYLAFYLGALANLHEIEDIFEEARLLSPSILMILLVSTAAALIPVRLFLVTAVAFDYAKLATKFAKLFPLLLPLDLLWGVSPFLLIHHIPIGLALGISAALLYMPFAQRSLVLMAYKNGSASS